MEQEGKLANAKTISSWNFRARPLFSSPGAPRVACVGTRGRQFSRARLASPKTIPDTLGPKTNERRSFHILRFATSLNSLRPERQ